MYDKIFMICLWKFCTFWKARIISFWKYFPFYFVLGYIPVDSDHSMTNWFDSYIFQGGGKGTTLKHPFSYSVHKNRVEEK